MRYLLLTLLCLIAMIAYIQRAAIAVPLAKIAGEMHVDLARDMGWVQSAWYFGYAVMQLPSGWLADRIGSRTSLALFCLGWSLLTFFAALTFDFYSLMLVWGLMGAAQAGIFPCSTKAIGQTFADHERARAAGLLACGMAIGGAMGPWLTGSYLAYLAPTAHWPQVSAWRICLAVCAIPGILWIFAFLELIPESVLPATVARKRQQPTDWTRVFRSLPLLLLCGQQFLRAATMVFFLTWFPAFLQQTRGVSPAESGALTLYAGLGGIAGSLLGGFSSDAILKRTGNKRFARQGIAVVGMSTCALMFVLSYFITDVNAAILVIGIGVFAATFGGVSGYTVAIEFGGRHVATVFSIMNMCGNLGAMLFPVTVGLLINKTGNWNLALFLSAGIMAIDAVCWAFLNPRGTLFGDENETS